MASVVGTPGDASRVGGPGEGHLSILLFPLPQLPERSFFLFGSRTMYSLAEVQAAWQNSINPLVIRQFIGNASMGWKLAWSDRMVSFYTSIWIFGVIWWPLRRKAKPLPLWAFVLLLLPMVVDGGSHAISDMAGIGRGFRDSNLWLSNLTGASLAAWFYAGDALGSFNSWMRLTTGLIAGLAIPWLVLPYMHRAQVLNSKLDELNYGKVLEQIKVPNTRPARG